MITSFNAIFNCHVVLYDDGVSKEVHLLRVEHKWLPAAAAADNNGDAGTADSDVAAWDIEAPGEPFTADADDTDGDVEAGPLFIA